jgi:hypothetical protein
MKKFVPFTKIIPATLECLEPYEYTAVKMVEETDYPRYFQQRWEEGESFITIEHDTVFERGAIEELENCPEEFCGYAVGTYDAVWDDENAKVKILPYRIRHFVEGTAPTLALIKFERSFIKKHPNLWDGLPERTDLKPRWQWCDSWLHGYTNPRGILCHQHYRYVNNANPGRKTLLELEQTGDIRVMETIDGASAGVHMPTIMVENDILDKNGKRKVKKEESEEIEK